MPETTETVPIRRRSLPEVVTRAADILEVAMHDIDAHKGAVSADSWVGLIAALGILRSAARAELHPQEAADVR